jgi:hypothetical protein
VVTSSSRPRRPHVATLDRMQKIVAEHLKRFACREELAVDWVRV